MSELVEFYRARLDADEEWAALVLEDPKASNLHGIARRLLAEAQAGKQILRDLEQAEFTLSKAGKGTTPHDLMTGAVNMLRRTIRLLSVPHAGHPDYRKEWRP